MWRLVRAEHLLERGGQIRPTRLGSDVPDDTLQQVRNPLWIGHNQDPLIGIKM